MRLPDGVFHRPREKQLIAKNTRALIEIATTGFPGNELYKIKSRIFDFAIAPYLKGDWADFDRLFRLKPRREFFKNGKKVFDSPVVYGGAEHSGKPKKPNITVVPNLQVAELRGVPQPLAVLGCTMGHRHVDDSAERRIQELYEFQSYGLLAVDREEGEVEVWVAQDGDKVSVPNVCHMTLYNLGDEDHPLITLDFTDPNRNKAEKKTAEEIGPVLFGYYDDLEVVFLVNHLHINNPKHKAGVRLPGAAGGWEAREIRISRIGRLDLGAFLYEQLTENAEVIGRLAKLGIRIRKASPEATLEPYAGKGGSRLYISRPLVEAMRPGTDPYEFFISGQTDPEPGNPDEVGIVGRESRAAREKEKLGRPRLLRQHVVIVVEGVGEWVTGAYRPILSMLADSLKKQGKRLSVYYADDSRWKEAPEWTKNLHDHEVYLDKADPKDSEWYDSRAPDIVFVVTPDFTHCEIAHGWVSRKALLVFVEKPFDSHLENVEALFNTLGRNPGTSVLGLDHYQYRAHPLRDILPEVVRHLGGALAKVEFYMTETQPLELGRVKTLQHGLTLDMLPHMLALLTFFGAVESIDDIQVLDAGRYGPEFKAKGKKKEGEVEIVVEEDVSGQFHRETYSKIRFTLEDYSGNGYRVPCVAVVGKGFKTAIKHLEITGGNGNAIRIEFSGKPKPDPAPGYPWGHIMFLFPSDRPGAPGTGVTDPYRTDRRLHLGRTEPIVTSKNQYYQRLIEDLINGTSTTLGSTLLPSEAWAIVQALDRIWWAIQDFKDERGWSQMALEQTDPVGL